MTQQDLQAQLENALNEHREHIARMSQEFSHDNMSRYNMLQERVRSAQAALTAFENNSTEGAPTTVAQQAIVHLIRAGKASKVVEVPTSATLRSVLDIAGWEPGDMTFQIRKENMSIDVTNIDQPVGEGTHEFICSPKYAAG